jgi:hypothetical protein
MPLRRSSEEANFASARAGRMRSKLPIGCQNTALRTDVVTEHRRARQKLGLNELSTLYTGNNFPKMSNTGVKWVVNLTGARIQWAANI